MKAKLKFNLNNIDDKMAFERFVKSEDMALVLWEIVHNSRKSIEWQNTEEGEKGVGFDEGVDAVYKRIYELMEEHDLNIDKLIL